jgi:hypothetical protein
MIRPGSEGQLAPELRARAELAVADARILRDNQQRQLGRLQRAGLRPLQLTRLAGDVNDLESLARLGELLDAPV